MILLLLLHNIFYACPLCLSPCYNLIPGMAQASACALRQRGSTSGRSRYEVLHNVFFENNESWRAFECNLPRLKAWQMKRKRVLNVEEARVTLAPKLSQPLKLYANAVSVGATLR